MISMRHNHLCGGTPPREPEMSTFELRGWYVSHDIKFADDVTTSVEFPARPTREQAEGILFSLASAELDRWRGGPA